MDNFKNVSSSLLQYSTPLVHKCVLTTEALGILYLLLESEIIISKGPDQFPEITNTSQRCRQEKYPSNELN